MARTKVEQVQCDRCKRMELLPIKEGTEKDKPDFTAILQTKDAEGKPLELKLEFNDLCPRCKTTLGNYWQSLEEWDRDGKPLVGQEPDKAPPLQPAPNYTPPKPHSPAAAKK